MSHIFDAPLNTADVVTPPPMPTQFDDSQTFSHLFETPHQQPSDIEIQRDAVVENQLPVVNPSSRTGLVYRRCKRVRKQPDKYTPN